MSPSVLKFSQIDQRVAELLQYDKQNLIFRWPLLEANRGQLYCFSNQIKSIPERKTQTTLELVQLDSSLYITVLWISF